MFKNKKKINKKCLKKSIEEVWKNNKNDPNGSYIGTADDLGRPIQDADDL